jgi:copper chaperone CopZ
MECQRVKKKLVAFLDNELSQQSRAKIDEHLDSCPLCKEELNNLLTVFETFCFAEEIEPSAQFRNAVFQRIEAQKKRPFSINEIFQFAVNKPIPKIAVLVLLIGLLMIPAIVSKSSAATKVLINVEGMTPDCCEPIKANLIKFIGIKDVEITPDEGVICITLREGKQVNLKKVEMAICAAGPYICKDFKVISDSMKKSIIERRCKRDEK